jgi:hypothetical protein
MAGHRQPEATLFFERLCSAMTREPVILPQSNSALAREVG